MRRGGAYPSPYPQQQGYPNPSPYPQQQQQQQGYSTPQTNNIPQGSRPSMNPATQGATAAPALGSDGPQEGRQDAEEEPTGFFAKLFRRNKKPDSNSDTNAPRGDPNDPNKPPVEVANSAGWCASKPLDPESTEVLRGTPLAPSR